MSMTPLPPYPMPPPPPPLRQPSTWGYPPTIEAGPDGGAGTVPPSAQEAIASTCDEIKEMLLEKNRKYGNSALEPARIFSKASPQEQLRVRLDDKLSRLRSGQADDDEDVVLDLIGYLILLRVAGRLRS